MIEKPLRRPLQGPLTPTLALARGVQDDGMPRHARAMTDGSACTGQPLRVRTHHVGAFLNYLDELALDGERNGRDT